MTSKLIFDQRTNEVTKIFSCARYSEHWIINYINKLRNGDPREPITMNVAPDGHSTKMPLLYKPKITASGIQLLCKQLCWLHENNIRHGDIKKSNIMMDNNGDLFFIDFEFSSLCRPENNLSPIYGGHGTVDYFSPELATHKPVLCIENDVWAFGVLIFYYITNEYPFGSYNESPTQWHIRHFVKNEKAWNELTNQQSIFFSQIFVPRKIRPTIFEMNVMLSVLMF
jgi:serine/threonine protein kinase